MHLYASDSMCRTFAEQKGGVCAPRKSEEGVAVHVFICQLYSKLQFGEFVPVTGIFLCFAQVGLSVENGCFRFENGGTYQLALSFSGTNLRRISISLGAQFR